MVLMSVIPAALKAFVHSERRLLNSVEPKGRVVSVAGARGVVGVGPVKPVGVVGAVDADAIETGAPVTTVGATVGLVAGVWGVTGVEPA